MAIAFAYEDFNKVKKKEKELLKIQVKKKELGVCIILYVLDVVIIIKMFI